LAGKTKGKRPLARPGYRWEDIRMDLTKIGWECVYWMHLAEGIFYMIWDVAYCISCRHGTNAAS